MATITVRGNLTGGGVNLPDYRTITADNVIAASESLAAAKSGTAGAAGVMTLGSSHGITDSDTVCVVWATGKRYGCAVSSYDGTTITVNGATGDGDALPTSGTVYVSKKTEIDLAFNGTNLVGLWVGGAIALVVTVEDAGGVELAVQTAANAAYSWDLTGSSSASPVTGDTIIKANAYNAYTTAGTANIIAAYNND